MKYDNLFFYLVVYSFHVTSEGSFLYLLQYFFQAVVHSSYYDIVAVFNFNVAP